MIEVKKNPLDECINNVTASAWWVLYREKSIDEANIYWWYAP